MSVFVSVRIGRGLIRDLSQLRKEAHEVSGVRLPSVMRRLAAGEQVDVETEAPRLEYGKDEIGQVGQALNTLQCAAVEAAVQQADLRRGVSEVFVNLARRNQVLLHRQLTLLDTMERRTEDTDELADLFRLDHLTTRMRRHAEGLVILSGAAPSRQWRKPVQLMDVVRAAVAEVEDYERIEVCRLPRVGVGGPAVADLTHLVAELLENATVFSPPHTAVQVHGERVANGFTLEIHDRGLGDRARCALRCQPAARGDTRVRAVRHRPARPLRGQPARPAAERPSLAADLPVRRDHRDRLHPGGTAHRRTGARGQFAGRSFPQPSRRSCASRAAPGPRRGVRAKWSGAVLRPRPADPTT